MPKAQATGAGRIEFIALIAVLTAIGAFSVDSMLTSLPRIAEELTPDAPNLAQLNRVVLCDGHGDRAAGGGANI